MGDPDDSSDPEPDDSPTAGAHASEDRPAAQLDDDADREELRTRYDGLLQELRVLLPGVQVLVAFLLTAPFAQRFGDVNDAERVAYLVSVLGATFAVVAMITPTAFHRVADRRARSARLVWGIRVLVGGLAAVAVALVAAVFCVTSFVFGSPAGISCAAAVAVLVIALWVVLPLWKGDEGPAS